MTLDIQTLSWCVRFLYLLGFFTLSSINICIGQVKDTIREEINYRQIQYYNYRQNRFETGVTNYKYSVTQKKSRQLDTIPNEKNFRKSYLYQSRLRQVWNHPLTYYAGIQLNDLIAHNKSGAAENPYTFSYSIDHKKSGYGIGFAHGFWVSKSSGKDSVKNEMASEFTKNKLRFSAGRKHLFYKYILVGGAFDITVLNYKDINKTFISGFVNEQSKFTRGVGYGGRLSLSVRVLKFLYVGTETSFSYFKTKESAIKQFTGLPAEVKTTRGSYFQFIKPYAIFLTLKVN